MSLELNKLERLVDAHDLEGICSWVDEVVATAKESAVEEHVVLAPIIIQLEALQNLIQTSPDPKKSAEYAIGALAGIAMRGGWSVKAIIEFLQRTNRDGTAET